MRLQGQQLLRVLVCRIAGGFLMGGPSRWNFGLDFGPQQRRQLQVTDPPSQRFSCLPEQCPTGRTQQQETPRPSVRVDFGAQLHKQVGHGLHFVDDHQVVTVRSKKCSRVVKFGPVSRKFQIQKHRAWRLRRHLPRQGGLAYLASAQQDNTWIKGQSVRQIHHENSINHPCILIV